jgi:hypothetical protein
LLYDNYPTHKNYDPVTKKYNRYYSHLVGDYPPPFERHGTAWAKDFMRRACNLKVHHWGATIEPVTDSVRENLGDLVASGQVSVSHDGKRKIMVHEHVRGLAKLRTPIDVWWIELYEVERKYVGPNAEFMSLHGIDPDGRGLDASPGSIHFEPTNTREDPENPRKMDDGAWEKEFEPIRNHLNPDAGWGPMDDDQPGYLFETYGKELEFVKAQDRENVWTLIEGDEGGQFIVNGFHIVNRIGYFVTAKPCHDGCNIIVATEYEE